MACSLRSATAIDCASPARADYELPIYTLLVPLYREAHMLPRLVASLSRLDYPAAELDIKLVLEASGPRDHRGGAALAASRQFEVVVVPEHAPAHQAKGAQRALPFARGNVRGL